MSDHGNASALGGFCALFACAMQNLLRNPARSAVVAACVVAVLSPFVTAMAVSEGIKEQYANILRGGPDVYVASDNYGSNAPIDLAVMQRLATIQGVTRIVPRVTGRTYVRDKFIAVLGVDAKHVPRTLEMERGRVPTAKGEVAFGRTAAEYLGMNIGSRFSITRSSDQVFEIVGLFRSHANIRNADLLLMGFRDACELFGIRDKATDLMVYTRPGYEKIVDAIVRASEQDEKSGLPALRIQTRDVIKHYSQRGFNIKAGVFTGFYCLVFALAIPSIGVISGFGQSGRRREIGVMKALGWQTPEVLQMVALENLVISVISVPLVLAVAAVWIYLLNGAGITAFFIANQGILIPFQVPARIVPVPLVLAIMMAVILTMVGSTYSTWKTAVVPPWEAMRM
jgi:ABC-type lipoprotein release transport system permease subunit